MERVWERFRKHRRFSALVLVLATFVSAVLVVALIKFVFYTGKASRAAHKASTPKSGDATESTRDDDLYALAERAGSGDALAFAQSPQIVRTPDLVRQILHAEISQTRTIDFDGDGKLDFIALLNDPNPREGIVGTEVWIRSDGRVVRRLPRYGLGAFDYVWFINLDDDPVPEIISAFGYEDGIEYAIEKENLQKNERPTALFYFEPVLTDPTIPGRHFWPSPLDIKDIQARPRGNHFEMLCSLTPLAKSDLDGEESPKRQKYLPVIFFTGKTAQPQGIVEKVGKKEWCDLEMLSVKVKEAETSQATGQAGSEPALQSSAAANEQGDIAFAFANRTGTHLLTVAIEGKGSATAQKPGHPNRALCTGSRLLEVAFEEHQKRGPKDTGRQNSYNFEQSEGDRYRITNGKVQDDEVCLLTGSDFLAGRSLRPMRRWEGQKPDDCAPEVNASLSAATRRTITRCSILADLGKTQFVAAEFQPRGKNLLAALALVGEGKLRLHLEKAECDGSSAWRVDDGCEFDPAYVVPLFAWNEPDGEIELGIEWAGPESGALILYRSTGEKLELAATASRYWAPL